MSVINKLKKTLATLEGITADFKVSYLESSDPRTKQMFWQLSSQTRQVMKKLQNRIEEIEQIGFDVKEDQ